MVAIPWIGQNSKNSFYTLQGGVIMIDINFNACISSKEKSYFQRNMSELEDGLERIGLNDYFKDYHNNICFSLDNTMYTFYISENSIFYNGNSCISYSVGDLFINAVNVMREDMQSKHLEDSYTHSFYVLPKFNLLKDKFQKYGQQYKKPTIELLKAYYQDLLSIGFCDINSALIVLEFLNFFISDNGTPKKTISGGEYNLLYNSLFHSLEAPFMDFDFFSCEDKLDFPIDCLAPAVIETQVSIKNGTLLFLYSNIDIKNMLTFDKFQLIGNGYNIRTCEVCSRHFVNAGNKKYHSKVCPDCRNLSQRKRKSDNEFYLAYDRAYKAMYNRQRYLPEMGNFRNNFFINCFRPCIDTIKEKQPYFEEKNDLSGFQNFIKETMSKYRINKK